MAYPKVAIIILNWNGLIDTLACLESLKKIKYPNYTIYIVDNASQGNDVEVIRNQFGPAVNLLVQQTNTGYAEGNNIGIRAALAAGADFCLLLNNDTTVKEDFLNQLVESANGQQKIIGGKIFYFYQPKKIWFSGGMVNPWLGIPRNNKEVDRKREVDFITGCMTLIHKDVFQKIGLLNKDYFAYWEDLEFGCRAKKANFQILYNPEAICYHKISASGKQGNFQTYLEVKNRLTFIRDNLNIFNQPTAYLTYFLLSFPLHVIKNIFLGRWGNISAELKGILRLPPPA